MIKLLTYLIFINSYCCFELWQPYSTSVYANDYLYVYDTFRSDYKSAGISKYKLEDGPIKDFKVEYFNLPEKGDYYSPVFVDIPEDIRRKLPKGDKAWLFNCGNATFTTKVRSSYPVAQLQTVEDDIRDTKSISDVENPKSGNMTQSAYGVTGVREGDSFIIYVFGGIANNDKFKSTILSNSFHKYDTKANKWTDIGTKSSLEVKSAFHKAINVDDKYIYVLGGIYVLDDLYKSSVAELKNITLYYKNFKEFRRYNIAKEEWEYIATTSSEASPVNFISGRYGFSATYHQAKIYVYGGVHHESNVIDNGRIVENDSVHGYLGILDTQKNAWEWHEPKEPNGEKSDRKLAFHDSIIYNNQLILTHGGIGDDSNKYKVHAIDLDTKNFSDYIGPSPKAKSIGSDNSSGLPSYAIAIIVVVIILAILIIGFLVYRKRHKSKPKSENNYSTTSLQSVWAIPQSEVAIFGATDSRSIGLAGNSVADEALLNANLGSEGKNPDASRMAKIYMDLPYFQHEVDTYDSQVDNFAKER